MSSLNEMSITVGGTMLNMAVDHEGKAIRALLDAAKLTLEDYAAAIGGGITVSAVSKMLKHPEIGERSHDRYRRGLIKLGFDPSQIWDEPVVLARERTTASTPSIDYRPAMASWSKEQLRVLREVLRHPDTHEKLIYWIDAKVD